MITSLSIQNFQSHKNTKLEFHPGVNIIVGASDSGKTSILRALRWLIWNRPSGDDFRSDWGGITSVEMILNERHSIESGDHKDVTSIMRLKSDTNNQYFLNGTDHLYEAFGTKVPDEIQTILNIDDTNFQKQFDSPFLISDSPGEVAAYFNKIAHLDQIDSGLRNIAAAIRKISSQGDVYADQLIKAKESEKQYEYLEKFEIRLESLEAMGATLTGKCQNKSGLELLVGKINEVEDNIVENGRIVLFEKATDHILALYSERETVWHTIDSLQEASAEITRIESDIEYINEEAKCLPAVESLLDLWKNRREIIKENDALILLTESINGIDIDILAIKQTQLENEETFHRYMPKICPLCNQKINK